MKYLIILLIFGLMVTPAIAQEKPNVNVKIKVEEKNDGTPSGFELPKTETPGLSDKKPLYKSKINSNLGKNDKTIDIVKGDGLQDYKSKNGPKYFAKDKEAKPEFGRDQNLGDMLTTASFVNVVYRDHEFVDGDRIQVRVNGDIVQSDIRLYGTFQGFDLPLEVGANSVEFIALNQGSSGPNTAELHIYDDNQLLVSAKEWNLLTGNRATFLIIKQ